LKKISNKENVAVQIDSLLSDIDSKKQHIAKMASTALGLRERANEFTISNEMADSRTAYAISLYNKISGITWDHKTEVGVLKGCK
jgi:hypothetical protein